MYSTLWSAFVKFESVVGDSYSLTHLEADIVHLNSDCKALLVWWPVIGWKFGTKAETIHLKSDMLHSTRKRCNLLLVPEKLIALHLFEVFTQQMNSSAKSIRISQSQFSAFEAISYGWFLHLVAYLMESVLLKILRDVDLLPVTSKFGSYSFWGLGTTSRSSPPFGKWKMQDAFGSKLPKLWSHN